MQTAPNASNDRFAVMTGSQGLPIQAYRATLWATTPDFVLWPSVFCIGLMNNVLEFGDFLSERDVGVGQIDFEIDDEQGDLIRNPTGGFSGATLHQRPKNAPGSL